MLERLDLIVILPSPTAWCPFGAIVWWSESEAVCDCLLRAGIKIQHRCDKIGVCQTCAVGAIGGDNHNVPKRASILSPPKLFWIGLSCQLFSWKEREASLSVLVIELMGELAVGVG
ncbi:(2Fe-2S) ferredoxin [Candidatus Tremblaya phenacola PAVE]|nr:(2Fe-2S) ferredoxin [Candidatus Tremblaya phenacola PAVE]